MSDNLSINIQSENNIMIFSLVGRIDTISSKSFENKLNETTFNRERVILDLSQIDYISSAGLRVLLILAKKVDRENLIICNMKETIKQIFTMSGFDKMFKICASLEEAKT